MSSSAEIHTNGDANSAQDRILRPRAVKATNPVVLRALSDEGYLSANGTGTGDYIENGGTSTATTRQAFPPCIVKI
jgi:sterol O-acyltransferase